MLTTPAHVTDEAQVDALAQAALSQFGHIDIWGNNAGVTLFGLLEQAPFAEHRRVIETLRDQRPRCVRVLVLYATGRWRAWHVRLWGSSQRAVARFLA